MTASALIHPPQPVCRYCHSHNMGVREVSGRAVLSAFTVNHRFSIPGLSAPYVVAQVAIEEDPRVRLTTNIIDCDPDELELGRIVEVVFEQNDDVWLPLFKPTAEPRRARCPRTRSHRRTSASSSGRCSHGRSSRTPRPSPGSARRGSGDG